MKASISIFGFLRCSPALYQFSCYRTFIEIGYAEGEMIYSAGICPMPQHQVARPHLEPDTLVGGIFVQYGKAKDSLIKIGRTLNIAHYN